MNVLPVLSSKCKTLIYGEVVTGVSSRNDPTPTDKFHKVYSSSLIISSKVDSFALPQQVYASSLLPRSGSSVYSPIVSSTP